MRWRNVPVPEASVLGILGGLALERVWPWQIGPRATGWVLTAAGVLTVARSLDVAADTDLDRPESLVTDGPYARSRNPMYVAWHLIHLGIGLGVGSGWVITTAPLAGLLIHRDVLREERRLENMFGDVYQQYRSTVRRYV